MENDTAELFGQADNLEEVFLVVQWLQPFHHDPKVIADWLNNIGIAPVWGDDWNKCRVERIIKLGEELEWNAPVCASSMLLEKLKKMERMGVDCSAFLEKLGKPT